MKKKGIVLLSCSIILLCVSMVVGGTYALFTDSLRGNEHLQAGTLDVQLQRTSYEYAMLNDNGYLETTVNTTVVDFTQPTNENVFGLNSDAMIVPGSYAEADMVIVNNGNVAFDYDVTLTLSGDSEGNLNALAQQLRVTVTATDANGNALANTTPVVCLLSDCKTANGYQVLSGARVDRTDSNRYFTVRIDFLDDVVTGGIDNNAAQGQEVFFDLLVSAVQTVG